MAKLIYKERKTPVLTKVVLPCITDYYNINITGGCVSGCVYCYAQGYSSNPKNETITFYHNSFTRLERELVRKRSRPKIVYFSSASEPFAPFAPALDETYKIMDLLMKNSVNIFISTKSRIPERFIELFSRRPESVHVQVGITTADDEVRKVLEPNAAPVKQRLMNMERLNSARVFTEARLDPLIPGITDREESLEELFPVLAGAGINNAISSYLFLRTSNRNRLRKT
jgi:DNA repair photolyase